MDAIFILMIGIAIGVILTAKPDALRNMNPIAFNYTLLGLALFGASMLLEWIGFTCVMVAFVLYHVVNWPIKISWDCSAFWNLFKRKKKDTTVAPDPDRDHVPNSFHTAKPSSDIGSAPDEDDNGERPIQTKDGQPLR